MKVKPMSEAASFYPDLDIKEVKKLVLVRDLIAENPGFFLDSPYSVEMQSILTGLFKVVPAFAHKDIITNNQELDVLEEVENLFKLLKDAKADLGGNSVDTGERMNYFKVLTQNLEKIITLKQQALNIKEIHVFYQTVINAMEDVLTPTQRTDFMDRLRELSGIKKAPEVDVG